MKSERLKKLEAELSDLEQWMKLGLVPKKEIQRHTEEIENLKERIDEEKRRLQILKETGEVEEYVTPKRSPAKTVYADTPSMSEIEGNTNSGTTEETETNVEAETEVADPGATEEEKEEKVHETEEEDDPFSDRNRWRRGGIIDPDATEW